MFPGLGMSAMSLAPTLVLLTVGLVAVGSLAFATWLANPIALIVRSLRRISDHPDAVGQA